MYSTQEDRYDLLKRYGSRWAILKAMSLDMEKKGIRLPSEVSKSLEIARIEIKSGCYSTCIIDGSLSRTEGELISKGWQLGEEYVDKWFGLLADSMQGDIDPMTLTTIPALKPVEGACGFMRCTC